MKKALESVANPKLIPCFSYHELSDKATGFISFLEKLDQILKGKKPSIYVITKVSEAAKSSIIHTLKEISKSVPEHKERIKDICKKLVIFSSPVNGRFVGENSLSQISEKLLQAKGIRLEPDLPISNGAKNRMRMILDTFDKVLVEQFDFFFSGIVEPMVYKNSLEYNIETLKDFRKLQRMEDMHDYLIEKVIRSNATDIASLRISDIHV